MITHHVRYEPEVTLSLCRSCHTKVHLRKPGFADLCPVDQGAFTTVRLSWSTKDAMREAVTGRGFPDSVSDEDALRLLVGWIDKYVPLHPAGVIL